LFDIRFWTWIVTPLKRVNISSGLVSRKSTPRIGVAPEHGDVRPLASVLRVAVDDLR
jgi:hypothetical protein